MPTIEPVTVSKWQAVIKKVVTDRLPTEKINRRVAFEAVQALLRGGIEGQDQAEDKPFSKLGKSTVAVAREANKFPGIKNFLERLRSLRLQSLGVHIVDPIAGRLSTIWTQVENPTASKLAQAELYSRVWNRIYRRLFRPSATLINAIESGVLPWQWNDIVLPTATGANQANEDWYANSFFQDTKVLASELQQIITLSLPENPDPEDLRREGLSGGSNTYSSQEIATAVQHALNRLKDVDFSVRLERFAARFHDEVIQSADLRTSFRKYLRRCGGDNLLPFLDDGSVSDPKNWGGLLDVIQAIQSSILSQPAFCDQTGLWVYKVELKKPRLNNTTSIYFIFGLTTASQFSKGLRQCAKMSFESLGTALSNLISRPPLKEARESVLVDGMHRNIQQHQEKINRALPGDPVEYDSPGVKRWLWFVKELMMGAKHENRPITYNIGYGSLAYAQAHLYQYEPAPPPLAKLPSTSDLAEFEEQITKIGNYIKGFYSIFGNRRDRGLWFNELGEYCGVFESADNRDFEHTKLATGINSHHESTILFAKIKGVGLLDILDQTMNQIVRVKDGKIVEMGSGDVHRIEALKILSRHKAIPPKFSKISELLVNQLVECLQAKTHGTSFILSFGGATDAPVKYRRSYCSTIESQTKTLIQRFSRLEAPLATLKELQNYAEEDRIPERHLCFLAELANLDGGLWLRLSDKGLEVEAAQQFIPLLKLGKTFWLLDLQMDLNLLGDDEVNESYLPISALELFKKPSGLKSHFAAINGMDIKQSAEKKKYVDALSFLHHSGTKTHSLWGMSMTAAEQCLCVVISSDGNVYIFHDGREFTRLERDKSS